MFVNVYLVNRCYGGPEEGGWWYDHYDCVETVDLAVVGITEEEVDPVIERLQLKYASKVKGKSRAAVLGGNPKDLDSAEDYEENDSFGVEFGQAVDILVESAPAESRTTSKPRYE